ncbi:class I SAM-dependent methyltransferase [Mycobacterium sp. 94-17]|uniref:class I SAM-dependent methyltransferase n=1 Tax=Mycobacterium sp. 94-17 TaxID=2986147 RepID=UPI002D1EF0F4|nr:class I SAM-dependent methyltransferase [Mycobacterium sp. 94-17]MEB4212383.1 class I SAM-dependent methyltransferase [Mycobacterium sp. 94-17]
MHEIAAPGTMRDVRTMYEAYPYPSPTVGNTLIGDVANSLYTLFGEDDLAGKRILDAGCGTGQRLLAVARRYPKAQFVGLDMTAASLAVAEALKQRHDIRNVEFRRSEMLNFSPGYTFDIITSIGVVHHLEDPTQGIEFLASLLGEGGILILWLYHSLGEHQRLLDRETLLTLWDRSEGLDAGLQVLQDLGLQLEIKRYGSSASQSESEVSQASIDVDAYLHPIVNAYRFDEIIGLLRDPTKLDWAAVNNVNLVDSSKLLDLGEIETGDMRYLCQTTEDLFESESLRQRFRALEPLKKLRVLENLLKPTGFTVLGGRGDSYQQLSARVRSSVISL